MSTPLNTKQWGFGQEHNVDVNDIEFSQHHLDEDKVNAMAKQTPRSMPTPIAAKVDDKYVIQDGHHRVAAAIKQGRKRLTVKVF